ncbi:MAG: hypothetical protein ABUK08_00215 [Candidatus Humimicrobiaceae bacterium]
MKVYKIELMVIDHDDIGEKDLKSVLENTRYPNHCISPDVMGIESRDIGEWRDDHPLNILDKRVDEYNHLFGTSNKIKFVCYYCGADFYESVEDIIHIAFTNKRFCSRNHLTDYLTAKKGE